MGVMVWLNCVMQYCEFCPCRLYGKCFVARSHVSKKCISTFLTVVVVTPPWGLTVRSPCFEFSPPSYGLACAIGL